MCKLCANNTPYPWGPCPSADLGTHRRESWNQSLWGYSEPTVTHFEFYIILAYKVFIGLLSHSRGEPVLRMDLRNGPLRPSSTQLGKPYVHSHTPTFAWGRNHRPKRSSLALGCVPGLGGEVNYSPVVHFTFSCVSQIVFLALMLCWNFSTGNLDCVTDSLGCEWLPKSVISRGSRTTAGRHWSLSMGHCRIHS